MGQNATYKLKVRRRRRYQKRKKLRIKEEIAKAAKRKKSAPKSESMTE